MIVLTLLVFVAALLYASVGHGGASGYLAAMALVGAAPAGMKPTALVLNLLVAGTGSIRYLRQGCFRSGVFWPFALGSVPFAFLGGAAAVGGEAYRKLLGLVLVVAALGMLRRKLDDREARELPIWAGVLIGAAIGYVSGLIGVGGGIFLSPLLILVGWASTRETLGIAALFILVNSAAGLAGHLASLRALPPETPVLAVAAFLGGLIGSELGARRLSPPWLRRLMAAVLIVAAAKLLLS